MAVRVKALSIGLLCCGTGGIAQAQFGLPMQLPENDFVWTWGHSTGLESRRSREDFSVVGNEASFRCELSGRMSLARGSDPTEMRELENQLRTSLFFIQDSARLMYELDTYRQIDWAMLDCKRPEADETEADLREREERARERAEKRRERRRAQEE